ncbi:MAG: type II toxin-antitoxin system Phd/YefM family antitoxin [Proteobacteria bacterium]|nr:type II toxin-antitoxin system Phd/YefM family antitoxin [Pseudomonadota bacterium]
MKTITTVAARENFAELINQASYGGRRVILTRRGKPVAALVSLKDLRILEDGPEGEKNGSDKV